MARTKLFLTLAALAALTPEALAQDKPKLDTGDTAWMMISTAIVLMMTVPGVALFYAGMVRKKNVLATMMQSFSIAALVTVLWWLIGYSLAFSGGGAFIGDLDRVFLRGLDLESTHELAPTIPESVFIMFQMTFAIITCALIAGATADRLKFSALLWFVGVWLILVYCPIAHMVWHPKGLLADLGVLDFAGGTVVHINAGVAGLIAAVMLGRRRGIGHDNFAPYNLTFAVIGASLLWVGWFGFNAGSAVGAGGRAGMAMLVTQIAAGMAALAWTFAEWGLRGKPSVLGAVSGAVAGLVAITPASGYVLPSAAIVIGVAAGLICFWAATTLKHRLGYDDSLDVFGVHAVGGILGAILTGVFAVGVLSASATAPEGVSGLLYGNPGQLLKQLLGVAVTIAYAGIVSYIIFKAIDAIMVLRVPDEVERDGLDLALHGEAIQ